MEPNTLDVPPEHVSNGQLFMMMQSMHVQNTLMNRQLGALDAKVEAMQVEYKGMAEAWRTSQSVVSFMKLLALIGLPMGALWALLARQFQG